MIAAPSRELLETVCEAVYGHSIADAAAWCRVRTCPSHRIAVYQRDNPLFRALTQSWTVKALAKALMETITEEKKCHEATE